MEATKKAKELKEEVDRFADKLEKMLERINKEEGEQPTCEEVFQMADTFLNHTYPAETEIHKIQADYKKCRDVYNDVEVKMKMLEEQMFQLENKMNLLADGKIKQEDFTDYYQVVRDLHEAMGVHTAILNRRAASAVVFLDKLGVKKH